MFGAAILWLGCNLAQGCRGNIASPSLLSQTLLCPQAGLAQLSCSHLCYLSLLPQTVFSELRQ